MPDETSAVGLTMFNWPKEWTGAHRTIPDESKMRKPEHLLAFGRSMYDKINKAVAVVRGLCIDVQVRSHTPRCFELT
jgi:hypothetical protein